MALPVPDLLIVLYAGLNILSCLSFVTDKVRAKRNAWRIPERTLLLLAALGPFGALAAMAVFRHKTRHTTFLLVPFFAVLHAVVLFWLIGTLPV